MTLFSKLEFFPPIDQSRLETPWAGVPPIIGAEGTVRPDRAGVLPPPHEENRWPRVAFQTLSARAVRLGVCRCRCGCDPAHPCRLLSIDPAAVNSVADRCGKKLFLSHPILTESSSYSHAYCYFRSTYFESADLSLQLFSRFLPMLTW